MEEEPGHLGAMYVPNGHVGVDGLHVLGHFAYCSVVSEGVVLPVYVVEEGWSLECSVYGSVYLGLVVL